MGPHILDSVAKYRAVRAVASPNQGPYFTIQDQTCCLQVTLMPSQLSPVNPGAHRHTWHVHAQHASLADPEDSAPFCRSTPNWRDRDSACDPSKGEPISAGHAYTIDGAVATGMWRDESGRADSLLAVQTGRGMRNEGGCVMRGLSLL